MYIESRLVWNRYIEEKVLKIAKHRCWRVCELGYSSSHSYCTALLCGWNFDVDEKTVGVTSVKRTKTTKKKIIFLKEIVVFIGTQNKGDFSQNLTFPSCETNSKK